MADGTFGTVITCMDGRVQEPVSDWAKENFGVDFVDTITEPGVDLQLNENLIWQDDKIHSRLEISVKKHGSQNVAVVGHHDCAGNPVNEEKHRQMIKGAAERIRSWGLPIRIVGLWVGEDWKAEVVVDLPAEK
jgi:carbonic anhydrase